MLTVMLPGRHWWYVVPSFDHKEHDFDAVIKGHLTIGGLGPLSRQYGAALDHVEEVEVVLANGTITRASNSQNTDLFFVRLLVWYYYPSSQVHRP